jgi:chorismate-pyruvate lyase
MDAQQMTIPGMEGKWMSRGELFCDDCGKSHVHMSLPPLLRLLLLSDGTVTHFLKTLFSETIAFELKEQSEIVISDEDANRLSLPKGEKVIKRQGWLTIKSRQTRVLYVSSILPFSRLSPPLYQEIIVGEKPLGQIIDDQKLLFRRDLIEIGHFSLPEISREFRSPSDPLIWARRYRLTLSGDVSALLFEAISPDIADFIIDNKACDVPLGKTK